MTKSVSSAITISCTESTRPWRNGLPPFLPEPPQPVRKNFRRVGDCSPIEDGAPSAAARLRRSLRRSDADSRSTFVTSVLSNRSDFTICTIAQIRSGIAQNSDDVSMAPAILPMRHIISTGSCSCCSTCRGYHEPGETEIEGSETTPPSPDVSAANCQAGSRCVTPKYMGGRRCIVKPGGLPPG